MSEEHKSSISSLFLKVLPVFILILADFYAMLLQPELNNFSPFAFALLSSQLLCQLVFRRGEICNGQRSRLSKINFYFIGFWLLSLCLSLFSNHHYVLTDLLCLCGIVLCLSSWKQPSDETMRNGLLMMGNIAGLIGILLYLFIVSQLPLFYWLQYSIFAQLAIAFALTHLLLVLAKNRLQGFIGLLPFACLIALILNSLAAGSWLYFALQAQVQFANPYALLLYFLLPLAMALIIALHILRKQKLSDNALLLLFFISVSLPLWAIFSHIA